MGVVGGSFAAIFIRLAEAPVLVIAGYRLVLASLILTPPVLLLRCAELKTLDLPTLRLPLLAGVFLTLHFGLWIASLQLTTVASSVVLVTSHPIFVALAAPLVTRDVFSPRVLGYAAVATVGAAIIGLGDAALTGKALWGDALALAGGLMAACYLLVGRRVGQSLSLTLYLALVYGTAAVLLAATVLLLGLPLLGYTPRTYLMFLLLALVPQLIGHSSLNWALRRLSAALVSNSILGEPVGATILALLVLGEAPSLTSLLGGGVVLAGIYLALREERRRTLKLPNGL